MTQTPINAEPTVQTVTGPMPVSALGLTLMHEHILCDLRQPHERDGRGEAIGWLNRFETDYLQNVNPQNMFLDDDEAALADLELFARRGGGGIVELTIGGIRPQPERLAALSEASGVPIVLGAGYYVEGYWTPDIAAEIVGRSEEEIARTIVGQLRDGAWGTAIRCGIIGEIGCSWPLTDGERKVLRAAAMAQAETGVAVTIHPGRHPDAPREIAEVLRGAGGDLSRTVIGHMDRTGLDRDRLLEMVEMGVTLEWDFFGIETSRYWMNDVDLDLPTDYMRLDLAHGLVKAGHIERIAFSHDICTRTRLASLGGHGYAHIPANVVPLMRRRGWAEDEIEQVLVRTPARLLGVRFSS